MARRRRGAAISVYLTEEIQDKLDELVEQTGKPISAIIREALEHYYQIRLMPSGMDAQAMYTAITEAVQILNRAISSHDHAARSDTTTTEDL